MKKYSLYAIVLACLTTMSCVNSFTDEGKTVFRYNESQGIPTLDPAFARSQVIIWPVNQIFNGLVQLDSSLGILPCMARQWEVSADGREFTFYLRNDVFFHEHPVFEGGKGRKATAFDVVYSFKRILDEKTASPGKWIFAQVDTDKKGGFEALNDTLLKIYLKQPFPAFIGVLAMQYCSVVPYEAIEHYGSGFGQNPVGTGPFMFKYWKQGEKLVLLKNTNYFETDAAGNHLPYLDAISVTFIRDKQSEFLEFLKGKIDFLSGVHTSYKNELLTPEGELNPKYVNRFQMIKADYLNTEYLGFLLQPENPGQALDVQGSIDLRRAINYGFDREKMMRFLRNGIGSPASSGIIPKGLPGFVPAWGYSYNPDTARFFANRVKSVYPGGLPPVKLVTTADYIDLCEYIQHELQPFGINLQIEVSAGATFRSMVANAKVPFFRASWIADYPDAENYLALFYSKNQSPEGPNYTRYSNPAYDALYEKALQTANYGSRLELYHKMDRMIINEAAIVPLYYDQVVRFTHRSITGLSSNPVNLLVLKYVKKVNQQNQD